MKRILLGLFGSCLLASAFAHIGDSLVTNDEVASKININLMKVFNQGLVQFDLIKDGTASPNQIKYIGFSNRKNKPLHKNLSNVDVVYFATTIQEKDPSKNYGIRMYASFDDNKNVSYNKVQLVDIQHSQLSADISTNEIKKVNFKKALDRYSISHDVSRLVQIILEKDHSQGFPIAIGFVAANSDSDLSNNDCHLQEFNVKTGDDLGGTSVYCHLF